MRLGGVAEKKVCYLWFHANTFCRICGANSCDHVRCYEFVTLILISVNSVMG